jgi:flagellar hook-associated protein 3 FlgL
MRITPTIQARNFLENINQSKTRLDRAQDEVSSGKKVNRLSDNPFAAAQSSEVGAVVSANEQFITDNSQLRSRLELTDSVLQLVNRSLDEGKSLAAQSLSGTTTPESRQALATAIEGVRQEVLSAANTQFNGTPLFAGTLSRTQPFADSSGVVSYQGNDEPVYQRVDKTTVVQTNVTGQDLFLDPPSVFSALNNLKTAISSNDASAIRAELANLETISSRVNTTAATFGNKMKMIDDVQTSLKDQNRAMQDRISDLTDANMVESITDMELAGQAVNVTLQAQARMQQLSLLDFLR